jgi:hypothetical protein
MRGLVVGRLLWHHEQTEPCSDNNTELCSVWQTSKSGWSGAMNDSDESAELMRGVGNLCIGADHDPHYDARQLVELLITGLRRRH